MVIAVVVMLFYQGFTMSINGVGAPWIAESFGLGESGIAQLYAWISISALGALILSRLADRAGRRRVLLWCMTATPLCALGTALSKRHHLRPLRRRDTRPVAGSRGGGGR
jgi:MFS family permease